MAISSNSSTTHSWYLKRLRSYHAAAHYWCVPASNLLVSHTFLCIDYTFFQFHINLYVVVYIYVHRYMLSCYKYYPSFRLHFLCDFGVVVVLPFLLLSILALLRCAFCFCCCIFWFIIVVVLRFVVIAYSYCRNCVCYRCYFTSLLILCHVVVIVYIDVVVIFQGYCCCWLYMIYFPSPFI